MLNSDEHRLEVKDICNCFAIQNRNQTETNHCVISSLVRDIILQLLLWSVPAEKQRLSYFILSLPFFFLYTFHFISNFDFIMEVHCAYLHCAYLNTAENWSREEMLFLNYLTVFLQDSILQLRFIICINCQLVFKVVIKS